MIVAVTKKEIESALFDRFGNAFELHARPLPETVSSGIREIDEGCGGFPRGAITEIYGAASSGRTSVLLSALSVATSQEETCALVDCNDTFDLSSAARAGIDFKRLLWLRCQHNLERSFKAADLVLHAGGFGFVALNIGDVPATTMRRIMSSWWFRFRRAIENTPTALIILTSVACARSTATIALELKNEATVWRKSSPLRDNGLTRDKREAASNLSLVSANCARSSGDFLSHAQFIYGMRVRVNRAKPVAQSNSVHFKPQLHTQELTSGLPGHERFNPSRVRL